MKAEKVKIIQSILVEKGKWGQQQLLSQLPALHEGESLTKTTQMSKHLDLECQD